VFHGLVLSTIYNPQAKRINKEYDVHHPMSKTSITDWLANFCHSSLISFHKVICLQEGTWPHKCLFGLNFCGCCSTRNVLNWTLHNLAWYRPQHH